jgi:hypothetical protein
MKKFTITIIALIAVSCSDAGDKYISLMCEEGRFDTVNLILNKENFTFDAYMTDDPSDIRSGTYQEEGENYYYLDIGVFLDRRSLVMMSPEYLESCRNQNCPSSPSPNEYAACKKVDLPEQYLNKASAKNQI